MLNQSPFVAAMAAALLVAAPASAQQVEPATEIASGVAFYETFRIGDLKLIPAAILRDTRCGDPRVSFCLDDERFDVSFVSLEIGRESGFGLRREIVLPLGKPTKVQGGTLTLISTGAERPWRGVRPLKDYALAITFEPDER